MSQTLRSFVFTLAACFTLAAHGQQGSETSKTSTTSQSSDTQSQQPEISEMSERSETEGETTRGLDEEIQGLKKEVIDLNRELFMLEEELLFPANTQVAVFISMDVGEFFALDSVQLKIDQKEVANYLYTEREAQALLKGGVHRVYIGNLKAGEHELVALFTGQGPNVRDYRRGATIKLEKGVGVRWIGRDGAWVWVTRGALEASGQEILAGAEEGAPAAGLHRDFIDCVRTRRATLAPAETAFRAASLGHLGDRAMRGGISG